MIWKADSPWKSQEAGIGEGYLYAAFTDRLWLKTLPLADTEEDELSRLFTRLLECRVFNENEEYHLVRTDIGHEFSVRKRSDTDIEEADYFDEYQYLDIDEPRTAELQKEAGKASYAQSTTGGIYELPLKKWKNGSIKIRNYLEYDSSGKAFVADWRMAGLLSAEERAVLEKTPSEGKEG